MSIGRNEAKDPSDMPRGKNPGCYFAIVLYPTLLGSRPGSVKYTILQELSLLLQLDPHLVLKKKR